MQTPLIWTAAALCSVAIHVGVGVVLLWSTEPDPVVKQPVPETRMQLSAHQVTQSTASEARPDAKTVSEEDPTSARLDQGAIPQSTALELEATTLGADLTDQSAARAQTLLSVPNQPQTLVAEHANAVALASSALPTAMLESGSAPTEAVALATPDTDAAVVVQAQPVALTQTVPDVPKAKASDVFSAGDDAPIDPVSLAAFQSFMRPEDAGQAAEDLRDGIDGLLAQVPCSRLQVQFRPETNTLDLTGHIPEDGLRAPVLSALQAQMGANIQVADNLLILPRPQCGALTGITDVGLPQSTDQITNPMLVGEDIHTREFRYTKGQQLVLELTGADYDAYIYVDYFDAEGQVIHLSPNASVPLSRTPAKSEYRIGAENQGDPGLFITIGPPYGQEIAVAFASSTQLYKEERPLVEPAAPYLEFLKDRVSAARAADPAFKGEWVYFFITTSEQ